MSDDTWRPLGVDAEDEIAEYDALHDGLPLWMQSAFWTWITKAITKTVSQRNSVTRMLDADLTEAMCQSLRIFLPDLRRNYVDYSIGQKQLTEAVNYLKKHKRPLQIADYILAHKAQLDHKTLNELLIRSKSAWEVGTRSGRAALVRRVPLGVQVAADSVIARAGKAGIRLAKAWEELYGLEPDPSSAYRFAIMAVEDSVVPVVSPTNPRASLGTVLNQIEGQGDWRLPMDREHPAAPSAEVLVGMMRMLWHGQHDRHGGQPSAPGNVSLEEATVAVSTAVAVVHWFNTGLVQRKP